MRQWSRVAAGALLALIAGVVAWGVVVPVNPKGKDVLVSVAPGSGSGEIARQLAQAGLIRHPLFFQAYVIASASAHQLQAGTYRLSARLSLVSLSRVMKTGTTATTRFTIVEGWSFWDISSAFESAGLFQGDEIMKVVGFPGLDYREETDVLPPHDFSGEFPVLADKPSYVSYEGYLFPDTYFVPVGSTAQQVVEQILGNFARQYTPELVKETRVQGMSVFEVITLASLIEKEVRSSKDKRVVAGILVKRLEAGMPLQVDASVNYVTGRRDTSVTRQETQTDSPYNTYAHAGLPLGPIANPGLESVEAALSPVSSPFWFYLSTSEGVTIFSKTLDEHNAAKARYL